MRTGFTGESNLLLSGAWLPSYRDRRNNLFAGLADLQPW